MNTILRRRRALMGAKKAGGLPSDYKACEWVGLSVGKKANNYIDCTDIPTDNLTSVTLSLTKLSTASGAVVVACNRSGLNTPMGDLANALGGRAYTCSPAVANGSTAETKADYTLTKSATSTGGNLALLGWSNANYVTKNRIYRATAFASQTQVMDAVPCYRIADSTIGMYDFIQEAFYPAVGTFWEKGADV